MGSEARPVSAAVIAHKDVRLIHIHSLSIVEPACRYSVSADTSTIVQNHRRHPLGQGGSAAVMLPALALIFLLWSLAVK